MRPDRAAGCAVSLGIPIHPVVMNVTGIPSSLCDCLISNWVIRSSTAVWINLQLQRHSTVHSLKRTAKVFCVSEPCFARCNVSSGPEGMESILITTRIESKSFIMRTIICAGIGNGTPGSIESNAVHWTAYLMNYNKTTVHATALKNYDVHIYEP